MTIMHVIAVHWIHIRYTYTEIIVSVYSIIIRVHGARGGYRFNIVLIS